VEVGIDENSSTRSPIHFHYLIEKRIIVLITVFYRKIRLSILL